MSHSKPSLDQIPLQPASEDIWDKKYRLKNKLGEPVDVTVHDTFKRVAKALSEVESKEKQNYWYNRFLWALERGAIPAGRITSNAGAQEYKPATSTINCTVSGTIEDSMHSILEKVYEAGLTLRSGAGIGYEFSTLRPKGAFVAGAGASTSGPLSFMDIYDKLCFTVSSAGGRRGAQMATFDVSHPDVVDFIRAKREDGRLRQFNLSLLITDEFIEAVKKNASWPLTFPISLKEKKYCEDAIAAKKDDAPEIVWKDWPVKEGYWTNDQGLVACKVYKRIPAKNLWDIVMTSTYDFAEPGFIMIDRVNDMNNNWFVENMRATNPCVTGDTRLATQYGMVKIEDLYHSGKELNVTVDKRALGHDERGVEVRSAVPAFMTAKKASVFRVVSKDGYEIKATSWHDFYTARGKLKLHELEVGDELLVQSGKGQFGEQGSEDLGLIMGLIAGDGHITVDSANEPRAVISLWGDDKALANRVADIVNHLTANEAENGRQYHITPVAVEDRNMVAIGSRQLARVLGTFGFTKETKHRIPEVVWQGKEECVKAYLRGLFQSDGTVNVSSNSQSCSVRLASSEKAFMQEVQMLLANFGVFSRLHLRREARERLMPDGKGGQKLYACRADYELIIDGKSRDQFMREIGFLLPEKNAKYADWAKDKALKKNQSFKTVIESIEYVGDEAVFDTTQKDNNTVIFNGLVTGQCGEQNLPPYGSCWTGEMRLNTNYGLIKTVDAMKMVDAGKPLMIAVDDVFSKNKTDLRPCTLVRNGQKEVFEVLFSNGQKIELTADHRVYTPDGWKEVQHLSPGSEVHVQAAELSHLKLVPDFELGALKYALEKMVGEHIVITKKNVAAFVRPILDRLFISYKNTVKGLSVSRAHLAIKEVERLNMHEASQEVMDGYLYAAQNLSASYKGKPALYGSEQRLNDIKSVFQRAIGAEVVVSNHGADCFRLLLPEFSVTYKSEQAKLDLDFALYGWLLTDGWLTSSTGLLFSDQDDVAQSLIGERFAAMTGTGGVMRKAYEGIQRDLSSIACYKKAAVDKLKDVLGLEGYRSKEIRVPEIVFQGSTDQQASFLSAAFCADGSIAADRLNISLTSASKAFLEDVQLLLLNFGIHASIHAQVSKGNAFYSLNVRHRDAYRFWRYIGFRFNTEKQKKLERILSEKDRWHNFEVSVETVQSIKSVGVQQVYDIEEFSTHTLVVNGVVVHNCLLGSVNLTKFVRDPFTDKARFDWDEYREVVAVFTRLLDNVVEINGLPLEQQRHEIMYKRRHGMGFLGLGSALTMMKMKYGSPESCRFTEEVTKVMAVTGWQVGLELAKEKGPAPIMDDDFEVTPDILRKRPEMAKDGYKVGDRVKGRVLHAKYSRYMQRIASVAPDLVKELEEVGARFTHHSSIAPTGTISLSLANNVSNGIEPSFAHHYSRNVIREGRKAKEKVDVFSYELLAYRALVNPNAMPYSSDPEAQLPDYFIAADDIKPKAHVDIQAASQRWIDSSISKTANVPTDFPYEEFKDIYMYAYEQGLKGCTTFRFNPAAFQGVLVKEKDLENTIYTFELENGEKVSFKGNEMVEYDGQSHTAANLFDALKEGYYGKF